MNKILIRKDYPWLSKAEKLRAKGLSYNKIAKQLGVSETTVWRALNPERSDRGVFRFSIKELNDFEKGLLVGLIEGEGSIGITKHASSAYKHGFALYPYVDINNTDMSLLKATQNILGKRFTAYIRKHHDGDSHLGTKPMYYVTLHKVQDVLSLLRQLQPHFISEKNRRRCEIVIKYCETRLKKRMSGLQQKGFWQYGDEELKLWKECKSIKGSHKKM